MRKFWKVWVCLLLIFAAGCNLTLGPQIATNAIIVEPGVAVRLVENKTVKATLLHPKTPEESRYFKQSVGGWIAFPPEHWEIVQKQYKAQAETIDRQRTEIYELKNALTKEMLK